MIFAVVPCAFFNVRSSICVPSPSFPKVVLFTLPSWPRARVAPKIIPTISAAEAANRKTDDCVFIFFPCRRWLTAKTNCKRTLLLAVVCQSAVFPKKVFLLQMLGNRPRLGISDQRLRGQGGNFFQDDGNVRRFRGRISPTKRSMACHQYRWSLRGIELCEAAHDRMAGVNFIVGANLRGREWLGERNWTIKVIGMRGAETRDFPLGLRPGSCGARVGMRHAANFGKGVVENQVSGQIGGGPQGSFDHFSVQVHNDEVCSLHVFVRNAARLDDDQTFPAPDPAGVSEGVKSKPAPH